MQPPMNRAAAPDPFHPASHECFKARDALVTSCEINVRKVDTTHVRKMRRRTRRLRWAAPAPACKSKRAGLEPRPAVPTASPPQATLSCEKSNPAGNRHPNSPPTVHSAPTSSADVPSATEASTAPPAIITSREDELPTQQKVSGVAASLMRPPGHSAQYGVDTQPSDSMLAQDAFTRHVDHGQPVRSQCRTDGPPANLVTDDKPPDCPAACKRPLEQASGKLTSVRDAHAQWDDQRPRGAKGQFGGVEPPPLHKDWASTPVDPTAAWIGHVLDGRIDPCMHRARWVDETIQSVTEKCVAHLQRKDDRLQLRFTPGRAEPPCSGTERPAGAVLGAAPLPSAQAEGAGPTNPRGELKRCRRRVPTYEDSSRSPSSSQSPPLRSDTDSRLYSGECSDSDSDLERPDR